MFEIGKGKYPCWFTCFCGRAAVLPIFVYIPYQVFFLQNELTLQYNSRIGFTPLTDSWVTPLKLLSPGGDNESRRDCVFFVRSSHSLRSLEGQDDKCPKWDGKTYEGIPVESKKVAFSS